jgi:DNA (cytosine-5)-methyltransferase 1
MTRLNFPPGALREPKTHACSASPIVPAQTASTLGFTIVISGYRTKSHVERETVATATLVARMGDATLDRAPVWDDFASFDGRPWRGAVDIVTAGDPCQPFSVAEKRWGAHDPRQLRPHVSRIIGEVEPLFFVLENVAHHLSLGFPEVTSGLVGMGY